MAVEIYIPAITKSEKYDIPGTKCEITFPVNTRKADLNRYLREICAACEGRTCNTCGINARLQVLENPLLD